MKGEIVIISSLTPLPLKYYSTPTSNKKKKQCVVTHAGIKGKSREEKNAEKTQIPSDLMQIHPKETWFS